METYFDNGVVRLFQADARAIPLADQTVHCVVTSPPYYGLRVYADNDERGIGAETSVEDYIDNMVDVFREVWRVLRDDGVAWLNIGDSYSSQGGPLKYDGEKDISLSAQHVENRRNANNEPPRDYQESRRGQGNVTPGNRMGVPEQLVMALQSDGWTWRDTIIWHKKSAMPESVVGWRWERCKVKVAERPPRGDTMEMGRAGGIGALGVATNTNAEWTDCDGCAKCQSTDGLVLRRGSWRTTQAFEYIYMLTKGMGYFADGEPVRTDAKESSIQRMQSGWRGNKYRDDPSGGHNNLDMFLGSDKAKDLTTANRRSVWSDISGENYDGPHFATFPSDLPRICIQASTSEGGCCSWCGAQYARVVDATVSTSRQGVGWTNGEGTLRNDGDRPGSYDKPATQTLGFRSTCGCDAPSMPTTVLDPFNGTATTCIAAQRLGRRGVGVDISGEYLEQSVKRLSDLTLPMQI